MATTTGKDMVSKLQGQQQNSVQVSVKSLLMSDGFKKRFEEILGKKAAGFMASIINVTKSNTQLEKCDPYSIISASAVAATLDLPIDPNLGFAWVVPYNGKEGKKAQFQMGWRGYVQLALRTSQYKSINVIEIYKGQLKSWNPLTEELVFSFDDRETDEVIGYAAYFRLVNGFEKSVYWSKEKVTKHAKRFSKTFSSGPWQTDFDEMAKKTVLKQTLSKWGILSIEMQTAFKTDQASIKGMDINDDKNIEYVDNSDYVEADYETVDDVPEDAPDFVKDLEGK